MCGQRLYLPSSHRAQVSLLQGIPHSMATRVPIWRFEGASGPRAVMMPAASWPKHMECWSTKVPFAPCE